MTINRPAPSASPPDNYFTGVEFRTRTLAYLKAIRQYGTFSQVSRKLHVSQPAISQAITSFEEQLGVKLLETQGRRKKLTAAGERLADFSTEILNRSNQLRQWLDSYAEGKVGVFRVGMIDAAVLYLLPSALEKYRRSHPDVELQIYVAESNALLERLRDFELDLALMVEPSPSEMTSTTIATEKLFLFSPQGSGQAEPARQPWALPPAGSRTRTLIDRGLARLDIVPNVSLESRNPMVLRQMAALGIASTVLPEALAAELPQLAEMRGKFVCQRNVLAVQRPSRATGSKGNRGSKDSKDKRAEEFTQLAQEVAQRS